MQEQRRALRQSLREQQTLHKQAQRAQPTAIRMRAKQQRRRKRQLVVLLILLVLLLLLRLDCADCAPTTATAPAVVLNEPAPPEPTQPRPVRRPKLKLTGNISASDRAAMNLDSLGPPSWLPQFRMQVAARGPRLASCFDGTERSGALRWSALVHARNGKVTESVVEPVFRGSNLDEKQLNCLIKGLSTQPYVLDEPDPEAAARRVSLIFEF